MGGSWCARCRRRASALRHNLAARRRTRRCVTRRYSSIIRLMRATRSTRPFDHRLHAVALLRTHRRFSVAPRSVRTRVVPFADRLRAPLDSTAPTGPRLPPRGSRTTGRWRRSGTCRRRQTVRQREEREAVRDRILVDRVFHDVLRSASDPCGIDHLPNVPDHLVRGAARQTCGCERTRLTHVPDLPIHCTSFVRYLCVTLTCRGSWPATSKNTIWHSFVNARICIEASDGCFQGLHRGCPGVGEKVVSCREVSACGLVSSFVSVPILPYRRCGGGTVRLCTPRGSPASDCAVLNIAARRIRVE